VQPVHFTHGDMALDSPTHIIGAGPAGLCAANELAMAGSPVRIFEMHDKVGGIARTESWRGFLFDLGGHRYHSDIAEVVELWRDMLGPDLMTVPRSSRIFFQGRFVSYPLQASEVVTSMNLWDCMATAVSYLRTHLPNAPQEDNLENWLTKRFGRRLYELFFRQYTEKVWGLPCSQIQSEWAPQRIQDLSMGSILLKALGFSSGKSANLISKFYYPRLGSGMMWEAMQEHIASLGGQVSLGTRVTGLKLDEQGVCGLVVQGGDNTRELPAKRVISSIPLPRLIKLLQPQAPEKVRRAAANLSYRSLIIVCLILKRPMDSDDQWIYVHDPDFKVGRMQVFKNWSPAMVPEPDKGSLGMEYFCSRGDGLWQMSDAELISLAGGELDRLFPGHGRAGGPWPGFPGAARLPGLHPGL
jgi:protoporphyrinogen oxidase